MYLKVTAFQIPFHLHLLFFKITIHNNCPLYINIHVNSFDYKPLVKTMNSFPVAMMFVKACKMYGYTDFEIPHISQD
jgi:hypothetical protein